MKRKISFVFMLLLSCLLLGTSCKKNQDNTSMNQSINQEKTSDLSLSTKNANKFDITAFIQDAKKNSEYSFVVDESNTSNPKMPVLIFGESHNSIIGQVQEAISFVQLYKNYHLRDFILEGYLVDQVQLDFKKFKSQMGTDQTENENLAVKLLKEGDISAVEFMGLVYDDVKIHPTEYLADYIKNGAIDPSSSLTACIQSIYGSGENGKKVAVDMDKNIKAAFESKKLENIQKQLSQLMDYVKANQIHVPSDQQTAITNYLDFLNARIKASSDIIAATEEVGASTNISLVAMVIGSSHTEGIIKMLDQKQHSYAVLTPSIFKSKQNTDGTFHPSDIPNEIFEQRGNQVSVIHEGIFQSINADLLNLPSDPLKKPQPGLLISAVNIRGQIYGITQVIAGEALSSPSKNQLINHDIDTDYLFVDKTRIISIQESNPLPYDKAILFEVNVKQTGRTVYVKAYEVNSNQPDILTNLGNVLLDLKGQNAFQSKVEQQNDKFIRVGNYRVTFGMNKDAVMAAQCMS